MTRTIFQHNKIYSLVDDEPLDGAILVENGKIAFIGTLEAAKSHAPEAKVVELGGAAVLPVFHDAHIHTGAMALEKIAPDLEGAKDLAEVLQRLRDFQTANPGDRWISGGRYDANKWECGSAPHKRYLDEIFGDRPVVLTTVDVHAGWANSAALDAAGITSETADPPGGKIVRDENGEATGLLLESGLELVSKLSDASLQQYLPELLKEVQQELLAVGLGHITDIDDENVNQAFLKMHERGELLIRVHKSTRSPDLDLALKEGRKTGEGDEWYTIGPVKFFSDGALGPHTAHMHEEFEGEPGNHGIAVTDYETMLREFKRANEAGLAVTAHAIGDKANTLVLNAFESVAEIAAANGLRNRIEHAQHIKPADISRFAKLGVIASMQPCHCTSDYPLSVKLLGNRDTLHYPWRALLDAGAHVAFGSDAPVEPANPFFEIHAAVTREQRTGQPQGGREPEQKISLLEALQAMTLGSAYAAGLEEVMGTLEVGKYADFITVDNDPFTVPESALWQVKVLATVMGGTEVFTAQ